LPTYKDKEKWQETVPEAKLFAKPADDRLSATTH
jgi:hypothetical protein